MAFLGQFEYTLDAKNRLTIPAKFRAALSRRSDSREVARPLRVDLAGGGVGPIHRADRSAARDPFDAEARDFNAYFTLAPSMPSSTRPAAIMLPQPLIDTPDLAQGGDGGR